MELAKAHEIQAAVVLHPGPITIDDIKGQSSLFNFGDKHMSIILLHMTQKLTILLAINIRGEVPYFDTWSRD